MSSSPTPDYIKDCPVFHDWVEYKGERYFATVNFDRSLSARRPMIDLFLCITRALNYTVIKTVQYDKSKFKII